jgi:hypothetical protein
MNRSKVIALSNPELRKMALPGHDSTEYLHTYNVVQACRPISVLGSDYGSNQPCEHSVAHWTTSARLLFFSNGTHYTLSMIIHELCMKDDSLSFQETTGFPDSRRCGFRRSLFQGMRKKLCRSIVLGIEIPRPQRRQLQTKSLLKILPIASICSGSEIPGPITSIAWPITPQIH